MYAGPLGSQIDDFIELLQEQGYDRHSIRCKIRSVADFSRWLHRHEWALEDVDPDRVRRFLSYRKRSGRYDLGDNAAVRQMTDLLRSKRIVPAVRSLSHRGEREHAEEDFRQHLLQGRGLSLVTLGCYQRHVSRFLRARFADGPIRPTGRNSAWIYGSVLHAGLSPGYHSNNFLSHSERYGGMATIRDKTGHLARWPETAQLRN